jgi:hypothetical protein
MVEARVDPEEAGENPARSRHCEQARGPASQVFGRRAAPLDGWGRTIPEEDLMAVLSTPGNPSIPGSTTKPVALPISRGLLWLLGAALLAVAVYYFIGVDEGAASVFGKSMVVHEFVHDARHFLGFPCH